MKKGASVFSDEPGLPGNLSGSWLSSGALPWRSLSTANISFRKPGNPAMFRSKCKDHWAVRWCPGGACDPGGAIQSLAPNACSKQKTELLITLCNRTRCCSRLRSTQSRRVTEGSQQGMGQRLKSGDGTPVWPASPRDDPRTGTTMDTSMPN